MALYKRRRARGENPLLKKERVLLVFKWISLAAFIATAIVFPGINRSRSIPNYGIPEVPLSEAIAFSSPVPLIIALSIITFVVFAVHLETLPRAILLPLSNVVTSFGFHVSFHNGRHATCMPRLESQLAPVIKITLDFPGNLLSNVRTCLIRVYLAPSVLLRVNLRTLAAELGFSSSGELIGGNPEIKAACFSTVAELNRIHAKSLNLLLLLKSLI